MAKTIALVANSVWNVLNFRNNLVRSLTKAGYEVVVLAPRDSDRSALATRLRHIPLNPRGTNGIADALLILRLLTLFRAAKPDIVLNFTIKPVIYGTITAKALGIPCVNNLTGLGTMFVKGAAARMLGLLLYSLVLRVSDVTYFQNPDDLRLFERFGVLRGLRVSLLPGSGVDLERFRPTRVRRRSGEKVVFLFVGRLLREKGIEQYLDASRIVSAVCKQARFLIVGAPSEDANGSAIRSAVMTASQERIVSYLGAVEDVRPHIARADCVVLPSYREGTPRSLLEAAAMGKPIIATDVPGCREVVEEGKNGYLCKVKDAQDLARTLVRFAALPAGQKRRMGRYGRRKMERQFDERIVIGAYLSTIDSLVRQ